MDAQPQIPLQLLLLLRRLRVPVKTKLFVQGHLFLLAARLSREIAING